MDGALLLLQSGYPQVLCQLRYRVRQAGFQPVGSGFQCMTSNDKGVDYTENK